MATDWDRWAALDARAGTRAGGVAARAARLARGHRAPIMDGDPVTRVYLGVGTLRVEPATPVYPPRTIDLTDRRPDDDAAWLDALTRRLTPRL